MNVTYIESFCLLKFYDLEIKELMGLVLKEIDEDIELLILDNLPLILKEDIIFAYKKGKDSSSSVNLFYKDHKVGEIIINKNKHVDYYSDNFIMLDTFNYEEIFKIYNTRIITKHKNNGVIFLDSDSTFISPLVEIEKGNYVYPGVFLIGKTKIGENNSLGPYSYLENFVIGGYNKISWFVGKNSSIGNNNTLGPFSHFRECVTIIDSNVIGNFNELKSTELGSNNRMKHLSYLGNVNAKNYINFGCGVISANYDGKNKHQTTIDDNVFIGCNTTLIAPLNIKKEAFVAAQSVICENLEEYDFAISRPKQITKKQYMKK